MEFQEMLAKLFDDLEGVGAPFGRGRGAGGNENMELVEAYENKFLKKKIQLYLDISQEIGGKVAEQALLVKASLEAERDLLVTASKHKTPKPDASSRWSNRWQHP